MIAVPSFGHLRGDERSPEIVKMNVLESGSGHCTVKRVLNVDNPFPSFSKKDMLHQHRVDKYYVERAKSAFYTSVSASEPLSTLEVFREAGKRRPQAANAWIERLRLVSSEDTARIFEQIPPDHITPIASKFAQQMLELNRQRLLALQGVLK